MLTAEPRLKSVARDFVSHYSDLWTSGKAMFVCLNKVTCVRMYNFVQKYWQDDIKALEKQIQTASQQEVQELERKLNWMKETEMAVVISQEQNEIQTFKKWNLDIKYHREKMEKRELDKEFKDKDNPLRVVFVCAMWLTGFDVKCLSCLYLDKPLKAHTLMQTIARANRVAEGKSNGLIIDYIGIVKALRKALADYTANVGGGSTDPTIDKGELIERVLETIAAADEFLDSKDFDLDDLVYAKDFAKISLLLTAANAVSDSRKSKKQFMTYGNELNRMMKYLDRDDISKADRERKDAIIAIVDELKKKKKHVDNTDLMVQINGILGDYIMIERAADDRGFAKRFDISKIDFDLLRREFAKVKKKNLAFMDLDELIQVRLDAMIRENPRRVDYYIRYQQIIEEYNSEQDRVNIEKTFMELMDLANSMNEEEQRYVREGFSSDEELSMYDMLFDENLSKEDIKKIKKVAVDLLDKINIYTVDRSPKIKGSKIATTENKKFRRSTIHQVDKAKKGMFRQYRAALKESKQSIKTKNSSIKVVGAAGAQTALSQMEGGEEVRDAANIAYVATRPVTGTASRGAELFRRKALADKRKRIKKVEAGKKLAKKTAKETAKTAAKEASKETAKAVAKEGAKVAAKVGTTVAGTAAGAETGPYAPLIGMAVGKAVGDKLDKMDAKRNSRNRKIKFFLDKMKAEGEQQDSFAKLVKDLFVNKMAIPIKKIMVAVGGFLLVLVLLIAVTVLPVVAVIAILYNSPFAFFLPPLESVDTVTTVTSAYY